MITRDSVDVFKPVVGETFVARWDGNQADTTLVEVKGSEEMRPSSPYGFMSGESTQQRTGGFTLVFRFPLDTVLVPQGLFELEHPILDEPLAIFLVSIAEDTAGRYMEAIFT